MFYTKREYYSLCQFPADYKASSLFFILLFFARIYHGIPLPCPLYYLAQGDHNNMCCNHAITIITKTTLFV